MALTLVRYFDLAGAVDADPVSAQPDLATVTAVTGPLVTGKRGRVLFNAWEVDAGGRKATPTGGLTVTIGVVTWSQTQAPARPTEWPTTSGTAVTPLQGFWGRGSLSAGVAPGEWQVQTELGGVVGAQVVVTAKSASPAGRWLAIFAQLDTPGPVRGTV